MGREKPSIYNIVRTNASSHANTPLWPALGPPFAT